MPRTIPGAIAAKTSSQTLRFVWLVEWHLSGGTQYYSSGQAVNYNGHAYVANRIKEINGLTGQYLDRKTREFGKVTLIFDNLADGNSSAFPFQALDNVQTFQDAFLLVHLYDIDAAAAVDSVWFGYTGAPQYNPDDNTCEVSATFLWDHIEVIIPSQSLTQAGFQTLATNRTQQSNTVGDETVVPLVYGVANFKIRPTIYASRVENGYFHVNFVVTGCASGLPMQSTDLDPTKTKLFDVSPATVIDFKTGTAGQAAPTDLTRFPDGAAHPLVAYAYAAFAQNDDNKDKINNFDPNDIRMVLANGRPLLDTGLPSENPVLILKDILRDPNFGLGLANTDFDATVVSASASYAASHWQARVEIHERISVGDLLQKFCADFHGFLTFNGGKVQIGVKTPSESSVATFATIDSGQSGRAIIGKVKVNELDADSLYNQARYSYRHANRHPDEVILRDQNAQARAGGTIKKVNETALESLTLYDETQVSISGAILLREELNGNLFIEFDTDLVEGMLPMPGELITVYSPQITNNGSNYLFRVISQSFDTKDYKVTIKGQVYKPAIYNYDTSGIGVDLLRGSTDTSAQGRPPDVTPTSLAVTDITTNDTDGKLATIRALWSYPTVDLASERANNIYREYPIAAVQLWWKYADESIHEARLGKEIKYPTAQGDFNVDYYKNRSIDVYFVALGNNRSRSPLGYIPDPTKTTNLTAILSATAATASVVNAGSFNVNDYAFCEFEMMKVLSKTSNSITFVNAAGVRTPQFDTASIAHPSGTEVSVAKLSYPTLNLSLTPPRFTYPIVTGLVVRQKPDSVKAEWTDVSAENQEKYYLYWSTDADASTNAAKLGVANPTWYLTDPNTPPAGVNLVKTDALKDRIDQALIGAAGTLVYCRVAARNGKRNWSSQLSAIASSKLSDDGVPVVTNAPRSLWKKNGLRVVCQLPATNMKTFSKVEVVIRAKNGSGTILGYLTDSTGAYTSQAGEYKFDLGLQKDKTFNISIKDLTTLFGATVATLEVYCYVSNAVGSSAASPIAVGTVAAFEGDDLGFDTAAPNNGVALTISRAKIKKGILHLTFVMPNVQMNTFWKTVLIIHDNNQTGTGRKFYDPDSSSWVSVYADGTTELEYGKGGIPALPISSAELLVGGRAVAYVRVGVYNLFNGGTATYSGDTAKTINTPGAADADPAPGDTAVPDVTALTPVWTQSGKHGLISCPLPATNIKGLQKVEIVVYGATAGGAVIGYLTKSAGAWASSGSEVKINLGQATDFDLNLKKADLATLFPNLVNLQAYYYVTNTIGTSLASLVMSVNYSNITDYLSSRGAVNLIEVGMTHYGSYNFLRNGDLLKNDPAQPTWLQFWRRWDGASLLTDASLLPIKTNSSGLFFSKTQHNVTWNDNATTLLVQKIGKVCIPGVYYTLNLSFKGSPNGFAPTMKAYVVKDSVISLQSQLTGNNLLADVLQMSTSNVGGVSTTTYKLAGSSDRLYELSDISNGSGVAADLYLVLQAVTTLNVSNFLILDRLDFRQGRQVGIYEDNPQDVPGIVDTSATGIVPGNVGILPDAAYLISGAVGGFSDGAGAGQGYA